MSVLYSPVHHDRLKTLSATIIVITVSFSSGVYAESSTILPVNEPTSLQVGPCRLARTFHQKFDSDFRVTPHAVIGRSWIAHTPWNGDFGDARFADPQPSFPFAVRDGTLTIEARKVAGRWSSGLIASADSNANGFAKQYGYFEIRAKLPAGKGLWPAIWLASAKPLKERAATVEIDIIEHYGHFPGKFQSVVHSWAAEGGQHVRPVAFHVQAIESGSLYSQFHSYGVDVERDSTTFYLDRKEFWQVQTPPEHKFPLMVLIDLALGSGWPINETPNPSFMVIDYVDVYERAEPCKPATTIAIQPDRPQNR